MKTTKMWRLKNLSVVVVMFILILVSCQKENDILNSMDVQNVNSESASASFVNENADMSSGVIGSLTLSQYGGRTSADITSLAASRDPRLKCAVSVTITQTGTTTLPAGTITIDFGTAGTCADSKGIIRKGKIIITYAGKRWVPGSTFSIQFENFYRNAAHIEGTQYNITGVSADSLHLQFISKLVGGKVTFADGRYIERTDSLTRTWYRSTLPQNDEWHIEGIAYGRNKSGNEYQMEIQSPLIHKVSCWVSNKVCIPVKGVKKMTVITGSGMNTYTVDYGDGTCDNQVTVTVNGKVKVITVNGDGN